MHRPNKRKRLTNTHPKWMDVKDRGTQSDAYVVEEWIRPDIRPDDPLRRYPRDQFFDRPRNLAVEWMDHFRDPPGRYYRGARVGTPLLPPRLPEDVRELISSYSNRPSLDIGLFPERREEYRDIAESRMPDFDKGVPCPVCGRFRPFTDLVNWKGDPSYIKSWAIRFLPDWEKKIWTEPTNHWLRTSHRGIYACSTRCFNEALYNRQAQTNLKAMNEGSYASFPHTWQDYIHGVSHRSQRGLDDLSGVDYFERTPRLHDEDNEMPAPTRSQPRLMAPHKEHKRI